MPVSGTPAGARPGTGRGDGGRPGVGARRAAVEALMRIERQGGYAHLVVPAVVDRADLDPRDRALAVGLVYGTTRMRRACDWVVRRHVRTRPDPRTRVVLRMGVYQLLFGGLAAHAVVDTTVAVAPRRTRGLVNAVLRKVADEGEPDWPDEATRLSYPDWIVDRLVADLGREDALAALEAMNTSAVPPDRGDGYRQDPASLAVVDAVDAEPGSLVADLCAGPGGKATRLAAGGLRVVATEPHGGRARATARLARRLGVPVPVLVADGRRPPLRAEVFDAVLVDAPCSGLGALRRRPDARWRITPDAVDRLAALQRELVAAAGELVRPGGLLVYAVCTLTRAETTDVAATVPTDRFTPLPPPEGWRPDGLLLPGDTGTDGMALHRWRRTT